MNERAPFRRLHPRFHQDAPLGSFSFGSETLARLNGGNAQLLSDNSPQHLFFPCDSTFKEQYTVWPKRNADIIRTYEESVIPYLDNLGENDAVKRKIVTTMTHIESLKRNKAP